MVAGLLLILIGTITIIVGATLPTLVPGTPLMNGIAVSVIGLVLFLLGLGLTWLKLYRKTSANQALVRTGRGKAHVVIDGGIAVIPVVHEVVPVSLETMKLEVERMGQDALITQDNLRVDVKAEFYIRVNPSEEDILQAARSLGTKSIDARAVGGLVFEKLVSALRSVAAQKDLANIHSDRKTFASAVQELVAEELQQNGLLLETVTISRLDQTDPHGLSDENIFDAQGKKKITEITAAARVERNRLEKIAEQSITEQNVRTTEQVLGLERQRAEAQATQERDVANIHAERAREKQAFSVEQERAVREAEIARDLAIETANIERDRTLIRRQQEREQTDIERIKAVELAERQKQIAIAEQEALRAQAEKSALEASAERERASQDVVTVQATAQAEREAQTKLIAAKQVIEQDKIKRQTDAEVAAFAEIRKAEAAMKAAELEAQAKLRLAQAEAQAKELIAQGDRAQRMVEVDVERERVNVEKARVDVERQALENRQTFERAALDFETNKLRIEAEKQVQMALAQALGQFMSKGNFNVYGDPTTMSQMFNQYAQGMGFSHKVDGLLKNLPGPVTDMLQGMGPQAAQALEEFMRGRDGNGKLKPADTPAAEAETA
ncbi:MAG: SPFH domain-containing protein [Armatimonadota bacterium]